jgi:drug/metabolite transporter (DMT)-like permease
VTSSEFVLVLGSAALHALWSMWIKESRDPVAFNWLQMALGSLLTLALLIALPELRNALFAAGWGFWRWLIAAGVCHGLYMTWMGRALALGDLSVVYPIFRSTPALLPFAAAPILGEQLSASGGFGIAIVVAGMWLVLTRGRLKLAALAQPGALFAWLTLASTVGYGITDKGAMLALDEARWAGLVPRALFYCLLTSVGATVVMSPFVLLGAGGARRIARCGRREGRRVLVALGVSLISYSLILEALRTAPASYVVTVRQTSVLFAVALGAIWLRERPGRARLVGAAVIVAGVALVGAAE